MSGAVRPAARPDDDEAILAVVDAAFSDDTRDAREELAIVRGTWAACAPEALVELVVYDDGVVGHALAAPGRVDGAPSPVAGVAPVCIAPSHQGGGLGTLLMREVIRHAQARGWPLLVLLGEPAFYGRVGFEAAGARGLWYAPAGRDSPHFLARPLGDAPATAPGRFSYCWETE